MVFTKEPYRTIFVRSVGAMERCLPNEATAVGGPIPN